MTCIRATCPDCGDLRLTTADITVAVAAVADASTYRFACPHCAQPTIRPAPARTVDMLLAAGCAFTRVARPAELDDHDRHTTRPAITGAEAVEFGINRVVGLLDRALDQLLEDAGQ